MCKAKVLFKQSSAAHGGQGYDLEVERCDDKSHDLEYLKTLVKEAIEAINYGKKLKF